MKQFISEAEEKQQAERDEDERINEGLEGEVDVEWLNALKVASLKDDRPDLHPERDFHFYSSGPLDLHMITFFRFASRDNEKKEGDESDWIDRPPNANFQWPLNWMTMLVRKVQVLVDQSVSGY